MKGMMISTVGKAMINATPHPFIQRAKKSDENPKLTAVDTKTTTNVMIKTIRNIDKTLPAFFEIILISLI
jgi:hypothetical protein